MIVIDSSILIAWKLQSDVFHVPASEAMQRFTAGTWGKGLLLEHVFVETISVIKRKLNPVAAIQAGGILRRSHQLEFVPASENFLGYWNEFQSDYLSPLSFVDHAIAVTARERAGGKVLTFDRALRGLPGIIALPEMK